MIVLLFTIVGVVLLFWGAIWVIDYLAPNHPGIIDRILWVACVVVVVLILAQAFGIVDVPVPRLR